MRHPRAAFLILEGAFLCASLLSTGGCDQLNPTYYTRPDSPGYTKQVFKTTCPICDQPYNYSQAEWDHGDAFKCPLHRQDSVFEKQLQDQAQIHRDTRGLQEQQKQELRRMQTERQHELQQLRDMRRSGQ